MLFATLALSANAHDAAVKTSLEACETSGLFRNVAPAALSAPYNTETARKELLQSSLGQAVLANLWVNSDKANPCFAISDTPVWGSAVNGIPADVVGIEIAADLGHALVYVTGIPDYSIETPKLFAGFKPGNIYGVYKLFAEPQPDTRQDHEFVTRGAIGIFVNGGSIFNYTDSFSYKDKGAWLYDANVAEATIVNSDIAHATPSDFPGFPKSRGIFHNHQMSVKVLTQLDDPFVRGTPDHSRVVGYAIDSYPIYGPVGYTSADRSSGLKVLKSSYVKRDWLAADGGGTGHRSALPDWVVRGWHGNYTGDTLRNSFEKKKADMLFADGASGGPVTYAGDDEKLAAEIKQLSASRELKRDAGGYVYWEHEVTRPDGTKAATRNYLLKSSDLWGPDIGQKILPVSYQIADQDKFLFEAVTGTFAEDYDFIQGYGDLDFYNGIESYVPELGKPVYHYVTPYNAELADADRLTKASFPYFLGIEYKGVTDSFNGAEISEADKAAWLTSSRGSYRQVMDLGVIGKDGSGKALAGSVIENWRTTLGGN